MIFNGLNSTAGAARPAARPVVEGVVRSAVRGTSLELLISNCERVAPPGRLRAVPP